MSTPVKVAHNNNFVLFSKHAKNVVYTDGDVIHTPAPVGIPQNWTLVLFILRTKYRDSLFSKPQLHRLVNAISPTSFPD